MVLVSAVVAACQLNATYYRTPEIVGLVAGVEVRTDGLEHVKLADGHELALQQGVQKGPGYVPLKGSFGVTVGSLVLAGSKPSDWYISAALMVVDSSHNPGPCYFIDGSGVERDDSFDFDVGLTLRRSPDFSKFGSEGPGHGFRGGACLDEQGRLASVGYGLGEN